MYKSLLSLQDFLVDLDSLQGVFEFLFLLHRSPLQGVAAELYQIVHAAPVFAIYPSCATAPGFAEILSVLGRELQPCTPTEPVGVLRVDLVPLLLTKIAQSELKRLKPLTL